MKTDVLVHLSALSNVNGKHSIREGSTVYVRVIKSAGNNSYIASFAGGRFFLKSEIPLAAGSGFLARIKVENGRTILQKLPGGVSAEKSVQKITLENQTQFLENLGLPPDNISFSMLQQIKMLGSRFLPSTFQKARKIAEKINGREKAASDAALVLEEKGISSDEKKVAAILEENRGNADEILSGGNENFPVPKNSFKAFFEEILNSSEKMKNQPGILTLFNHLGFDFGGKGGCLASYGNWIKLPFDFYSGEKSGSGCFCGFLKNSSQKLEKAVLIFNFQDEKFAFEFGLSEKKLLYLNAGCSDSAKNEKLIKILMSCFENSKIGAIDSVPDFSEFSAGNIEISKVNLNV